jgi:hypothetical protein
MTGLPSSANPARLVGADGVELLARLGPTLPQLKTRAEYLADLLRLGPRPLVEAADLERFVLVLGDKLIPGLVNDGGERRCCLVSPDVHYVQYMKFELDKIKENGSARALALAVNLMGRLCAPLGFNRCVSLNNWLFTTNPALRLTADELLALRAALCRRYPDHALVIRNVDARDPATRRAYREAGWRLVVNRPVHEWSHDRLNRFQRNKVKKELRLLDAPGVTISHPATLGPGDEDRVSYLYRKLYLQKHSLFNPHYTPRFFRSLYDSGIMTFTTISRSGQMMAFCTHFDDGERIVAALVGYEIDDDVRLHPHYRTMMACLLQDSMRTRRTLFLSTGAATFKLSRGSREWYEHEAVYDAHLSRPRRLPWALFGTALELAARRLDTTQI